MTDDKLNKWVDMWEKAQENEIIKSSPSPQVQKQDFFGLHHQVPNEEIKDDDIECWNKINGREEPQILTEQDGITPAPQPLEPDLSKKEIGDVASTVANAANPIQPSSVGKDQNYKPNLADVQQLEQLHNMKVNLYDLESKLNAKDALAQSSQGKKIQTQIKNLKVQIDKLSDAISPDFLKSYLT